MLAMFWCFCFCEFRATPGSSGFPRGLKCMCHFCAHAAALLIQGPTKPIVEGQQFTVACLTSDSEFNISQVHLEMFSKVRVKGANEAKR